MSGEAGRESVQVTNDGATILKAVGIDNPAGKVLVGENSLRSPLSRLPLLLVGWLSREW